jgi:hypothetical protein
MIDRKKLLPAIVVCFCLFFAGLLLLAFGQKKSVGALESSFDEVLEVNTTLGATNERFAGNVITLQHSGALTIAQVKPMLDKSVAIAQANQQIGAQLRAAIKCGTDKTGPDASPADRDKAAAACARISAAALKTEAGEIAAAAAALNPMLAAVKNPIQRKPLEDRRAAIVRLNARTVRILTAQGVIR